MSPPGGRLVPRKPRHRGPDAPGAGFGVSRWAAATWSGTGEWGLPIPHLATCALVKGVVGQGIPPTGILGPEFTALAHQEVLTSRYQPFSETLRPPKCKRRPAAPVSIPLVKAGERGTPFPSPSAPARKGRRAPYRAIHRPTRRVLAGPGRSGTRSGRESSTTGSAAHRRPSAHDNAAVHQGTPLQVLPISRKCRPKVRRICAITHCYGKLPSGIEQGGRRHLFARG